MRLGAYPCVLVPGTKAAAAYGAPGDLRAPPPPLRGEQHYRELLTSHGLVISGTSPDKRLVEMIELPDHPYFVGCQFHPEFKSRPQSAAPAVPVVHRGRPARPRRSPPRSAATGRPRHPHVGHASA